MNPQQFPHPSRSRIHPAINEDVRPAPSSNIHKLTDVSTSSSVYQSQHSSGGSSVDEEGIRQIVPISVAIRKFRRTSPISRILKRVKMNAVTTSNRLNPTYPHWMIDSNGQIKQEFRHLKMLGSVPKYNGHSSSHTPIEIVDLLDDEEKEKEQNEMPAIIPKKSQMKKPEITPEDMVVITGTPTTTTHILYTVPGCTDKRATNMKNAQNKRQQEMNNINNSNGGDTEFQFKKPQKPAPRSKKRSFIEPQFASTYFMPQDKEMNNTGASSLIKSKTSLLDKKAMRNIFQMFIEYTSTIVHHMMEDYEKNQQAKGIKKYIRQEKEKTLETGGSKDYSIHDAKNYFDTEFRPRLQLLGSDVLDNTSKYFIRTALEIVTPKQVFCKNCGILDENLWCPCRQTDSGEKLIEAVTKIFGADADFIEFARNEIINGYQPKKPKTTINRNNKQSSEKPTSSSSLSSKKSKNNPQPVPEIRKSKKKKTVVEKEKISHCLRPRRGIRRSRLRHRN